MLYFKSDLRMNGVNDPFGFHFHCVIFLEFIALADQEPKRTVKERKKEHSSFFDN
jgi:hypothetical protein